MRSKSFSLAVGLVVATALPAFALDTLPLLGEGPAKQLLESNKPICAETSGCVPVPFDQALAVFAQYEAEAKLRHGQLLVGQSRYQDALPLLRRAYELKPRNDIQDYVKQVERIAKTRS